MPYLEDIETIKTEMLGKDFEHKGHWIYGNVKNEEYPMWSSEHNIDYTAGDSVLRILFAIVLRIDDEP